MRAAQSLMDWRQHLLPGVGEGTAGSGGGDWSWG